MMALRIPRMEIIISSTHLLHPLHPVNPLNFSPTTFHLEFRLKDTLTKLPQTYHPPNVLLQDDADGTWSGMLSTVSLVRISHGL
jgi:hypothetical protein